MQQLVYYLLNFFLRLTKIPQEKPKPFTVFKKVLKNVFISLIVITIV